MRDVCEVLWRDNVSTLGDTISTVEMASTVCIGIQSVLWRKSSVLWREHFKNYSTILLISPSVLKALYHTDDILRNCYNSITASEWEFGNYSCYYPLY